jgi:hypothetical protein
MGRRPVPRSVKILAGDPTNAWVLSNLETGGETMAAYFIAQYVVNDPKLYREYQAAAGQRSRRAAGNWWRSTSPPRPSRGRRPDRRR